MLKSSDKESLVNRIIAGRTPLRIKNQFGVYETIYYIRPSLTDKLIADEIYSELCQNYSDDLLSEDELLEYLYKIGAWTEQDEEIIEKLPKDIEQLKIKCYESYLNSEVRKMAKKAIQIAKNKLIEVLGIKNQYSHLTITGTALLEKIKYLTGRALFNKSGQRIFKEKSFWKQTNSILDQSISCLNYLKISETDFREIARSEPWRSYWSVREACNGLFSKSAVLLTDDQKELINWSLLYDGVFSHTDCPPDDVIEDDDCLDGFLILDKKNRDKDKLNNKVEGGIKNERIRNADEVYIAADTFEDAQKIHSLNSDFAKAKISQRNKIIENKGEISEKDLPDVKQRLMMELNTRGNNIITGGSTNG